ncbi:DegT/DnrJ/EryC1/StrS family aminotransferase [Solidesulfovibrio sp.]
MKEIPFARPMIGDAERQAVQTVLEGPILVHGPLSRQFESDFETFTGAPHAVSCSSCTAAMHMTYVALGIGAGDEVVVPAQTHASTAHAVALTGATPVFAEADPGTGNVDPDAVEACLTERTKAIAVVHYLGRPVEMDRIMALAGRRGLKVIEDCALAVGTTFDGRHAGIIGDAGCFSFYPVKHITTAEGGMCITRHADLAEKLRLLRAFCVDRTPGERTVPGIYDVVGLGFNYRMNEMQAALGITQLKRVRDFLKTREANFTALSAALAEIAEIEVLDTGSDARHGSSFYCLSMLLKNPLAAKRFELVAALKARGVGTSVYYPKPVPHMTYYRERFGFTPDSFPAAARLSNASIALPVGPHLDLDAMAYVTESVKSAIMEVR